MRDRPRDRDRERERERGKERKTGRKKRGGGSWKDNIFMCVLENENGTVCEMFNAAGSGRGGFRVRFLYESPHTPFPNFLLQISLRRIPKRFFFFFCACRGVFFFFFFFFFFVLKLKVKNMFNLSQPHWFTSGSLTVSLFKAMERGWVFQSSLQRLTSDLSGWIWR